MDLENSFYLGYVSRTRGLKGELQLTFVFDRYEELEFDVLFVDIDRHLVPFFVQKYRVHNNGTAYFFLEDIDHIDKTRPLLRKKVYLPNSKLPAGYEDEFRPTELTGYRVIDQALGELGEISDVRQYPQQYLAAVIYRGQEVLFPLTDDLILSIDPDGRVLEVDLPEGLVDLYL